MALPQGRIAILLSMVLYVVACCLPALEFKHSSGKNDIMFGLRALAVGWSGIFAGVFAWYANLIGIIGLLAGVLRWRISMAIAGVIAVAIGFSTVTLIGRELPGDEGNVTKTTVIRLLPGFYVWMASLAMIILGALLPKRG